MEDKFIEKFIEASVKYGKTMEAGNAKIANKNSDIIRKIRGKWKSNQEDVLEDLLLLLNHKEDYVRLNAAFTLLPLSPDKAEAVLKELALKERCQLGFEAEMILREWKKGHLKF